MKRNPIFWLKKPRIAMYVPWLNNTNSGMPRSRSVEAYAVDPNNKHFENSCSTKETPKQILRLNAVSEPVTMINTPSVSCKAVNIPVSCIMETTKNTGYSNVKELINQSKSTNSSDTNRTNSTSNTISLNEDIPKYESVKETPRMHHQSSEDSDDSWDSDSCTNSIYGTTKDEISRIQSDKTYPLRKSKKVISNAKIYATKTFRNISMSLNRKEKTSSIIVSKVDKPKPDILKSDLVSTTNVEVQNMISSSHSLKKT